jgi:uridine kinase
MNQKPYIVGITGGSASGKTLFLKKLMNSFSANEVCLVSQDHYYKEREHQPVDEQGVKNFDTPMSINADHFAADIARLLKGETVEKLEYTFNNPNVVPGKVVFKPAPVIIVEGIFVFYYPEVANLIDLKVFIDAAEHIKLKRRIIRDKIERGYDLDDVLYRYEKHVAPTFEKYIKPFMYDADLIIPNHHHFEKALEVISNFLKSKLPTNQTT